MHDDEMMLHAVGPSTIPSTLLYSSLLSCIPLLCRAELNLLLSELLETIRWKDEEKRSLQVSITYRRVANMKGLSQVPTQVATTALTPSTSL